MTQRTTTRPPAPQPKQRVVVREPTGWAFRVEREAALPQKVCAFLVRLPESQSQARDDHVGDSRIPWLYRRARYIAFLRLVFAFVVGTFNIYFAATRRDDPPFLAYAVTGIILGYLHIHPLDMRYEMTSPTNPRPKVLYIARLAFYTAGWTTLTVLSLFIATTGIDARSQSSLHRKRDDLGLGLLHLHWLEPRRRLSGGRSRASLRGMSLEGAERGLLYTCAVLSILSL
ncbi:hypothetical protein SODALDRAFT_323876 [Sodiomyces alkalinus F11]|uniref:Uncharacterized protein n=1 Tax=Sodiomyces alkalinus (strain CBS 110278 / VKM F-3762 / F11) TaxID=1314773 RepID=A0A3N2PV57_SODAK|nr:hypothetical protein SODALDRAFT_323876 [Sodiomyces alkalinus F11]ROT38393.1 hypothetical protein SODALDRAFT_323876 [Sodiomyces alkalinus F11]